LRSAIVRMDPHFRLLPSWPSIAYKLAIAIALFILQMFSSIVITALRKQGIRSGGKEGTELLAQAMAAYRSALEIYTREQMPQNWAMTQNNLGTALSDQAARTEGPKGVELLAQAVAAFHSCLEI
jgi:hypothetical protein